MKWVKMPADLVVEVASSMPRPADWTVTDLRAAMDAAYSLGLAKGKVTTEVELNREAAAGALCVWNPNTGELGEVETVCRNGPHLQINLPVDDGSSKAEPLPVPGTHADGVARSSASFASRRR